MDKCDECKQPVSADFNYHKLRCSRWAQYAERFPMAWKYADNCGDWPPEDKDEKANQSALHTTSSKTITKCEECGQSVSADFNYHEKQCSRWASYQQFFVESAEDEDQMLQHLTNKAQENYQKLLGKIKDAKKELQRISKLLKDELVLENERLRKELLVPANLYYVSFQFEHKMVIQAPNADAVELWSRKHGGWFHSGSPLIQSFYFTTVDENGDPVQS
jgi:hypothetical protein